MFFNPCFGAERGTLGAELGLGTAVSVWPDRCRGLSGQEEATSITTGHKLILAIAEAWVEAGGAAEQRLQQQTGLFFH